MKEVLTLIKDVKNSKLPHTTKTRLLSKLQTKNDQLQETSYIASSVEVVATLPENVLTRGEVTNASVTITNKGTSNLKNLKPSIKAEKGWKIVQTSNLPNLKPGKSARVDFKVTVPQNAKYYHAYNEPALQAEFVHLKNLVRKSITFKILKEQLRFCQNSV